MTSFSRGFRAWLICGAAMAQLVPVAAQAQEESGKPADAAGPQDIVVTARRVAENLQTVPVSVSAVTADDIQNMVARDVMDLEGSAPNVQITRDTTYPSTATFTIRGETTLDPARYTEPAVVVALDQVFQPSINGALIDTFDMAQIEILRGPQGTLFGRNTIGGVVNIARKRPQHNRFGFEASVTAGSFRRFDAKVAGNIPILEDMLSARVVFTRLTGGGYARNRYYDIDSSVGKHRLGQDTASGRIALLFEPASNFSIYANYALVSGNDDAGGVWNFSRPEDAICAGAGGETISCGPQTNRELYDNRPNLNRLTTHWFSLQADWTNDWGTITAIASYIKEKQRQTLNFDGTELPYYDTYKDEHARTKTLEVRYSGEPVDGVAVQFGGYFMREKNDYFQSSHMFFSTGDFTQGAAFHSRSDAAFAQVDWSVTSDIRLTGGIRYTRDLKAVDNFYPLAVGEDFNPAPIVTTGGLRKTFKKPTWRLGADWQASPDAFFYASYARGYRAGGFNGRAGTLTSVTVPFQPELADSYEAGAKFTLLDRMLRLNLSVFRVDKSDLQVENLRSITVGGVPVIDGIIDNAATARIDGAEAEIFLDLPTGTRINANFGYLNGRYTHYLTTCGGAVCDLETPVDLSGKRLRRTPKFQYAVGVTQTVDLGAGSLIGGVDWRWRSSQEFVLNNDPLGHQKAYGILDGSLTFKTADERLSLGVFAKNITDVQYKDFAYIVSSLGFIFGSLNRPREFGVQLDYRY